MSDDVSEILGPALAYSVQMPESRVGGDENHVRQGCEHVLVDAVEGADVGIFDGECVGLVEDGKGLVAHGFAGVQ